MQGTKACIARVIRFRKWRRRGYSVLLSLKMEISIGVLCLAYSLVRMPDLAAQTDTSDSAYKFEGVEITGRRSFTVSSAISRVITVIQNDEIEKSGIHSFSDLLEFVSGADVRQRGGMGVQADISIRGSSFDHVMILVNGINMSDPQTGHLALDLPIDPESIERIEILEGPAARSLGPGAFMGAINIITRKGTLPQIQVSQTLGEFGLYRTYLSSGIKGKVVSNFISAGRSSMAGYRHNTDHEIYNIYYHGTAETESTLFDIQAGLQSKKFGAGGFYSPRFPDQYEENSTWFGSLKVVTGNRLKITPHVYWRRKNDHFLLDRNNPSFFENFHLTDVFGSQINITHYGRHLTSNVGADLRSENIFSNNIGYDTPEPKKVKGTDSAYYNRQYQRTNFSLYTEQVLTPGNWDIAAGLMVNWNTGFHGKPSVFPGMDVSYNTKSGYTVFMSLNRALHLPTFTDLFYSDPFNQGNLNLDPNRIFSVEGGLKYATSASDFQIAGFVNSGRDIIDWLWSYQTNRFSPVNLEKYVTRGFTTAVSVDFAGYPGMTRMLSHVSLNYLYLSTDKSALDSVSKYYSLKHKLSATFNQQISSTLVLTWRISYQDRNGEAIGYEQPAGGYFAIPYKPYWLIDGIVKWKIRYLEFYTEVSNILNTRYIDAGSAIQPGRWLKAGVSLKLNIDKRGIH